MRTACGKCQAKKKTNIACVALSLALVLAASGQFGATNGGFMEKDSEVVEFVRQTLGGGFEPSQKAIDAIAASEAEKLQNVAKFFPFGDKILQRIAEMLRASVSGAP